MDKRVKNYFAETCEKTVIQNRSLSFGITFACREHLPAQNRWMKG